MANDRLGKWFLAIDRKGAAGLDTQLQINHNNY